MTISNVYDLVAMQERQFNAVLVDDKINFEKEKQFANQLLAANDYLNKIAWSNQQSLVAAVNNIASIGISLNPASKHAYLVPRDGKVCLDISYMGLLHLAQLTGSILWGQCKLVFEGDTYQSNGLDKPPTHTYSPFSTERGAVIGGYCTVKTPLGDYLTDEMSIAEINDIMQRSAGVKSGKRTPWKTDFNEMARKTIVKRASKYWPNVDRLDNAIHHLNTDVGEGLAQEVEQELIINPVDAINQTLEHQGKTVAKFFEWASQVVKREIASFDDLSEKELQAFANKLEGKK